jgi:hypothetical protein
LLAAGCAQGSIDEGTDLGSPPVVALSSPGHIPGADLADSDRARATAGRDFGATTPLVHVGCKKNAFCEDFEGADPASRWTSTVATDGVVDFVGPSSAVGTRALRTTTTAAGAGAYLTLAGPSFGTQWVGSLAFSFRVERAPSTALGGPEIAVIDANGLTTRIGFSVRPDGIALHQHFDTCTGAACTTRSDLVTDVKPGEWRRLTLAVETTGSSAPPYGRIEITVDGSEVMLLPLSVTPFDGKAEVRAGITAADTAAATARVDDVVFFAHK